MPPKCHGGSLAFFSAVAAFWVLMTFPALERLRDTDSGLKNELGHFTVPDPTAIPCGTWKGITGSPVVATPLAWHP